uniref:Uncharacterized protein n=1 Tax=Anguilla anguilla TaxID=7936 RepID=A0A0E9QXA0_ANGAN
MALTDGFTTHTTELQVHANYCTSDRWYSTQDYINLHIANLI